MEPTDKLLKDYSIQERTAYLKAITALATADRSATEDEQYVLEAIIESAELPPADAAAVLSTAGNQFTETQLQESLDILKTSDLRYSLVTDLVAFAESDQQYSDTERRQVEAISAYLGVEQQQFSIIHQFVNKAAATNVTADTAAEPQGFLESLGMQNQFQNAGMNFGNISKGFLGMLLPLIMGKLMNRRNNSGGGLGGLLGGLIGNNGGGMSGGTGSGGLGSLISMLNGGRGMGNISSMLGKMFGR